LFQYIRDLLHINFLVERNIWVVVVERTVAPRIVPRFRRLIRMRSSENKLKDISNITRNSKINGVHGLKKPNLDSSTVGELPDG